MIRAKNAKAYCCEDISLIENYEQALNDKTQTWDCHHRLEIELGLSRAELIKQGLYWNRPASELIFLTKTEHKSMHNKGKPKSAEHRTNIGAANRDKKAKSIYQIHKATGIIIREWKCIRDVERVLGISQSNIVQCCKGNKYKTVGGFIWRYVDEH